MKSRNHVNPMLMSALWTAYRETVSRTGPGSINSRIHRRSLKKYIDMNVLE